jgi:NADH-quinone oxidoreductase subunit N
MLTKFALFMPETVYLAMCLVLFFVCLPRKPKQERAYAWALFFSFLGVVAALAGLQQGGVLFFWAYKVDLFSQIFKLILTVTVFLVVLICRELPDVEEHYRPEFFMFLATCTLGLMLMVSAVELMTLYLALELSSFSLYILIPLRSGDGIDVEAGVKYLFIGITASCVMLFGLSYIFGTVHTTYVSEILTKLPSLLHQPGAVIGLLLFLSGFFFKLAVFPFHFWAPDVYEGAANQVVTYIATASKAAAIALLIRMTSLTNGQSQYLFSVLIALCVASMFLGNLVAIVQKSLKRMLAYSAIAHAGYVMMGILTMSELGYSSAVFYTVAYMLMTFAAFMVLVKVASDGHNLQISELAGLHKRAPLLALTLMMALFSLAGIPPTVGFVGKFLVFAAAMKEGYFWLVLLGMINATISLYYYLMVIKAAYLLDPAAEQPAIRLTLPIRALNYALILGIVYLGIFPQHFLTLAETSVKTIFGGI